MKNKKIFCSVLIQVLFVPFAVNFVHAEPLAEPPKDMVTFEASPAITVPIIHGDKGKFEEDNWISRNTSGGITNMSFSKQLNHQDSLEFDGRAIAGNNDYNTNFNLVREGVGSLAFAFKEFRKYFDGTGGFYDNFAHTSLSLPVEINNPLHLDIGSFKVEGILAKENSPEYSLSYEREFRHGTESLLGWGPVTDGTLTRYINPTYRESRETVDKVKLGLKKVTSDTEFSIRQSWEGVRDESSKINNQTLDLNTGVLSKIKTQFENTDSDLYTTQAMFSKDLNKNLFTSLGLLYNHYIGGSMEQVTDTNVASYNENHPLNPAHVKQDTATFMPNISFSPLKDLQMGAGLKAELEIKNAIATYNRDYRNTLGVYVPDGIIDEFVNIDANTDTKRFSENAQFKFSRIKNVVFYGNAEYEKQFITQFEEQDAFGPNPSASNSFSRKTDTIADAYNFTLGSKWYPLTKVNVTVEDKYKNKEINNNNEFLTGGVVSGYRGFIDHITLASNSPIVKLNYKPFRWVTTSLGYTYDQGIYGIRTRAGSSTEVSKYVTHAYSAELTLVPVDYFYCSVFYQRRNDFTSTRADGAGGQSVSVQQPDYKANVDVLGFDYTYALTKSTSLNGGYSMYFTDNFNDFSTTGLPLGLNNLSQSASIGIQHSFKKDRSLELKYVYKNYSEDSNNHIDDYEAHLLYASMNMAF